MRYLLFLLLVGCAQVPTTDFDKETTREVRIVWHKTELAWAAYARMHSSRREISVRNPSGKQTPFSITATGFYFMHEGVCHVYAPDPPEGQWRTLGHEVKHCFDGRFHD